MINFSYYKLLYMKIKKIFINFIYFMVVCSVLVMFLDIE